MNSPPVSGWRPEAIGSSQRGSVTGLSGRGSGRPPGPVGPPLEPLPTLLGPALVELLHAESSPPAPVSAARVAVPSARNSRRVRARADDRRMWWPMPLLLSTPAAA